MGGRYYITGAQIGMLIGQLQGGVSKERADEIIKDLNKIAAEQYIGEMPRGEKGAAILMVDR